MTHFYLLHADPKNVDVQKRKNRREDLIQFQQYVTMGSKECFQGGEDDPSNRISTEQKLLNILESPTFSGREKEQSWVLYFVTLGKGGLTRRLNSARDKCDSQFGTRCAELMSQIERLLGESFAAAGSPDPSRQVLYESFKNYIMAQDKSHEGHRQAKKDLKDNPAPTVKVNGEEKPDFTGLASVFNVYWPQTLMEPHPEKGYTQLLDILQQGVFFNSWRPRLHRICDEILEGKMSAEECPFTAGQDRAGMPKHPKHRRGNSLGAGPKWGANLRKESTGSAGAAEEGSGPGLIVFVVGGICHEEIQVIYELINKHKKDVYVGSTHMTNPELFMEDGLKGMNNAGSYGGVASHNHTSAARGGYPGLQL